MAHFDKETFTKLKDLCAIEVAEADQPKYIRDLERMLTYVELLNEVNTDNVAPTAHVFVDMANTTRPDVVANLLSREDFMSNCPSHVAGLVKVPTVIKDQ